MIAREIESTEADTRLVAAFMRTALVHMGYEEPVATERNIPIWHSYGWRFPLVFDPAWKQGAIAGMYVACPTPTPTEMGLDTQREKGYELMLGAYDPAHPDETLVKDTLLCFGGHLAASEGRYIITARSHLKETFSHVRLNAMDVYPIEEDYKGRPQWGARADVREIVESILKRRPEWRTSLSSMT